jgi:Ni,Fe-hydrogenase I large subunit
MNLNSLQESHVLLVLGEVRGDVKGIARTLNSLEKKIEEVEQQSSTRISALEKRVGVLESIKVRVAAFCTAVALMSAAAFNKLPALINFIMGG